MYSNSIHDLSQNLLEAARRILEANEEPPPEDDDELDIIDQDDAATEDDELDPVGENDRLPEDSDETPSEADGVCAKCEKDVEDCECPKKDTEDDADTERNEDGEPLEQPRKREEVSIDPPLTI